jgi:hypothetical protein
MKDDMKDWFAKQDFNTQNLPTGHKDRFLEKLEKANEEIISYDSKDVVPDSRVNKGKQPDKKVVFLKPWAQWALVASIAVLLGIGGLRIHNSNDDQGLSSVSTEMAHAQDFFTSTINQELIKLNKKENPDNKRIINDTKTALHKLEQQYITIKKDYMVNSDSKMVIAAMIQNFQSRIDLLQLALEQIEQLNDLKEQKDETLI